MKIFSRNNEKGILLIWVYLLIAVIFVLSGGLYTLARQEFRNVSILASENQAFYAAEAGIDDVLSQLKSGVSPEELADPITDSAGVAQYQASYNIPDKTITSTGTAGGISKTLRMQIDKGIPPGMRPAAVSSNSDVTFSGNITIDGREHNLDGSVKGDGTYGISSGGNVIISGNVMVGGPLAENAPVKKEFPSGAYQAGVNEKIYKNPEQVLGLPPGSLYDYRSTLPPETLPNGLVYLTQNWTGANLGTPENPGSGILIVHNHDRTAKLENATGVFKGLIIADNIVQIEGNAEIIGGVVVQNSSPNVVGEGNAHIKYSSDVLKNLPIPGGAVNYIVTSWEDTQNT